MLRGAIIGLGNVALDGHLPGWSTRDGGEIVAVTDGERDRRAHAVTRRPGAPPSRPAGKRDRGGEAVTRMPGGRWFGTAEALLAQPGLDFVDICTPPSSHAGLI